MWAIVFPWQSSAVNKAFGFSSKQACECWQIMLYVANVDNKLNLQTTYVAIKNEIGLIRNDRACTASNKEQTLKKAVRLWPFSRAQWVTVDPEPTDNDTRSGSFSIIIFTTSEWPFSMANMNGFMSELSEALVSAPL